MDEGSRGRRVDPPRQCLEDDARHLVDVRRIELSAAELGEGREGSEGPAVAAASALTVMVMIVMVVMVIVMIMIILIGRRVSGDLGGEVKARDGRELVGRPIAGAAIEEAIEAGKCHGDDLAVGPEVTEQRR